MQSVDAKLKKTKVKYFQPTGDQRVFMAVLSDEVVECAGEIFPNGILSLWRHLADYCVLCR